MSTLSARTFGDRLAVTDAAMARLVRAGLAIMLAVFVLFVGWAAVSRLDSAVVTYGIVVTEGNRKAIQHPDGGAVASIFVEEGQAVEAGQELIRLDQVQARAALEIQNAAVDSQTATIARLEAERDKRPDILFPESLTARAGTPGVATLLQSQRQLLAARRGSLSGQGATIAEQIQQARSQAEGLEGQVRALKEQQHLVDDELAGTQMLFDKGLTTKPRLLALKRAAAAIEGQVQDYQGNVARLRHMIGQLESQSAQISRDQFRTVAQELEDARNKLADARERQRALQDVLDRTSIRAPVSGFVLGLSVHAANAVIGRGEKILEIVPRDATPIVTAKVRPIDGEHVHKGTRTELRVLSAPSRQQAKIEGVVTTRSSDVLSDERTGERYYAIQVAVAPEELSRLQEASFSPGTPIELALLTGSRTALEYMIEPLTRSFRRALREE